MKKRISYLIICLIMLTSFVFSLENDSSIIVSSSTSTGDIQSKVDKGYDCLTQKVKDKCSTSLEDNIFTLLAIKECKDDVLSSSKNEECWPKEECKIKQTAEAALALSKSGSSTDKSENWLISKNTTPSDLTWYLQIESAKATVCKIKDSGVEYTISIDENKKINSGAGNCLSLSEGNYWLRISKSCYDKEFEISCNEGFLTNLLYKKDKSSVIYISEKTNSGSSEGTTKEKVNSLCFGQNGVCDYEGSLWATLFLNYRGHDVSPYLPYLISMADENQKFLPDSFLYLLTGYPDVLNDLLLKQVSGKYWDKSGDKFYDTALALYPLQDEEVQEKTGSINWLLEVQGSDGCWNSGNIRDTSFILHSVWPKQSIITSGGERDCEEAGYYCMSEISCNGKIISGYGCSGVYKCCDTKKTLNTCKELGGEICNSNQNCEGGRVDDSSDISTGEICCIKGICKGKEEKTDCEFAGGSCKDSCDASNEEESSDSCGNQGGVCCIKKLAAPTANYIWIWILLILIILVVIAIYFRDKLRNFWFMTRSKFGGGGKQPSSEWPKGPPRTPPSTLQRFSPRRIFPPQSQQTRKPIIKSPREIDEVLKKLKEISK